MEKPILIADYMRQLGIFHSDGTVDHDLICALFYYESLIGNQKTVIKNSMEKNNEKLPAWAEIFQERLEQSPWFAHVAPITSKENDWCQQLISRYPMPDLLRFLWESALFEFCRYIRNFYEEKERLKDSNDPWNPNNPPESSLNWKIEQIHDVDSARTAFEHFIDPSKPKGKYMYYFLFSMLYGCPRKENVLAGEDCL